MLVSGRPEMVVRALKSFHSQTYEHKKLLILGDVNPAPEVELGSDIVNFWSLDQFPPQNSIGALRNLANGLTEEDIICHWDSDDWSHPNRIAEQVAVLQSSGAECVGYNEMLFWRQDLCRPWETMYCSCGERWFRSASYCKCGKGAAGEAWLYRSTMQNYALGTSMCYWSDTWRRGNAFPDRSEGCDDLYWSTGNRVDVHAISSWSTESERTIDADVTHPNEYDVAEARMIASIHGGNTCARLDPGKKEWTRVPEYDAYCRKAMQL